ncbi:MAG: sigma-70 family RNA polymerase sigma factor [Bacteroidetes bacterium]|nr:sigma-70 family RNA polymerase sigma factor [Bacteroidota bacterium]
MAIALSPPDEHELVLLLKQGDRKAFDRLYHHYKRHVYNKLRKILHSDEHAEELLQEIFFRLWLKREQLNPDRSFPAYLFRIAANMASDYFREAHQDQRLQDHLIATATELYDHIEPLIDYKESVERLVKLIDALPPQRRKIFNLCKIEGKTYEEVSILLGISTSTINDHIVKATRTIKRQFPSYKETAVTVLVTYLFYYL